MQEEPEFIKQKRLTYGRLMRFLDELNDKSIPFYSPRYSGHMSVDQNMPAILGYLATMFYNPNNVAFEASPFTTPSIFANFSVVLSCRPPMVSASTPRTFCDPPPPLAPPAVADDPERPPG